MRAGSTRRQRGTAIALAALIGLIGGLGLSGCAALSPERSGDDLAREAVEATATRIATDIDDSRPTSVLGSDLAYRYSDVGLAELGLIEDPSIDARGADDRDRSTIEPLAWEGMTRDDDGARFTLRISQHLAFHGSGSFGSPSRPEGDWTECYAFQAFAFFEFVPTTAEVVDCPASQSSPPPSPAPTPELPADAHDRLAAVLAGASEESLEADLSAAFPDAEVPPNPVKGAHLIRDSGAEDGVLAAAVGISGTTDCAVGLRAADGTVSTWHPQDVTLAAGESGCTIANALHPVRTH